MWVRPGRPRRALTRRSLGGGFGFLYLWEFHKIGESEDAYLTLSELPELKLGAETPCLKNSSAEAGAVSMALRGM